MSATQLQTRAERRAAILAERRLEEKRTHTPEFRARQRRRERLRKGAFVLVATVVLGGGVYLAAGDLMGQRGTAATVVDASGMPMADALPVRLSMAGFDPKVITAKAGSTMNLDFWNTDNAMHLDGGGVHTFIMPDQDIYVKIPPEARQAYALKVPTKPGDYDFYCNTCCGGKESPTMHGILRVEAA